MQRPLVKNLETFIDEAVKILKLTCGLMDDDYSVMSIIR